MKNRFLLRCMITGTYLAERRSMQTACYDIVSAHHTSDLDGSPRSRPPTSSSSKRRRRPRALANVTRCTVLPALASIDILSKDEQGLEVNEKASKPRQGSRLHHGRANVFIGGLDTPVPSDQEFHAWLAPPTATRTPRARTTPPTTNTSKSPKLFSFKIILHRKSFADSTNTTDRVVSCLEDVFGVDKKTAERMVDFSDRQLFRVVGVCSDHTEALRRAQDLRNRGLMVTVTSVPVASGPCYEAQVVLKNRHSNYGDLFREGLKGTGESCERRIWAPLAVLPPAEENAGTGWHNIESGIRVMPEDAVEAFFTKEEERLQRQQERQQRQQQQLQQEPHMQADKVTCSQPKFRDLVAKHRSTLEVAAKQVTMETEEEVETAVEVEASGAVTTVAVQETPKQINMARKEACRMLRLFVFGKVGNEDAKTTAERDRVLCGSIGTKEEMLELYNVWAMLDDDASGRADITEFRRLAEANLQEYIRLHGTVGAVFDPMAFLPWVKGGIAGNVEDSTKFIKKLCDKLVPLLLGKKSSFTMEDMVRLMWPCAQPPEIKTMLSWCKDFRSMKRACRVRTPPVLDVDELEGLSSVFHHIQDGSGVLTWQELVSRGLHDPEEEETRQSPLGVLQFCELMCPSGYRAHANALVGSDPLGNRVFYDEKLGSWRLEAF